MITANRAIIMIVLAFWLAGCTRTVYVPKQTTEVRYVEKMTVDSVYMSDTVKIYSKGDTVFSEKIRTLYKTKYVRDTITVNRTDSTAYAVEVVREKEVVPKWAWWSLALSAFFVAVVSIWLINKIKIR